jgi:hypothetical protein
MDFEQGHELGHGQQQSAQHAARRYRERGRRDAFHDRANDREDAPERLSEGRWPLLYSLVPSGGVAFICARFRARRIHAMETPTY